MLCSNYRLLSIRVGEISRWTPFFADMILAATLLQNDLTLVGTLRRTKHLFHQTFSHQDSEKKKFYPWISEKFNIGVVLPKKNKTVLLLSTMHDDNAVTDDKAKKPELINFCNQTKGEVYCLDVLIHSYMSERQTRQCQCVSFIIWWMLQELLSSSFGLFFTLTGNQAIQTRENCS